MSFVRVKEEPVAPTTDTPAAVKHKPETISCLSDSDDGEVIGIGGHNVGDRVSVLEGVTTYEGEISSVVPYTDTIAGEITIHCKDVPGYSSGYEVLVRGEDIQDRINVDITSTRKRRARQRLIEQ
jgi:hypothetical protein